MIPSSKNNILGTLGPAFSFHDILCKEKFNHLTIEYFNSFDNIFEALQKGQIQLALIAIKNSIHGDVKNNAQVISKLKLDILENFELPISLHLAAQKDIQLDKVKKIFAHVVAWNECQFFLNDYTVKHIDSSSNSQALADLKNSFEPNVAAISGLEAINQSGLHLVRKNIHDQEPNITTFSLVARKK